MYNYGGNQQPPPGQPGYASYPLNQPMPQATYPPPPGYGGTTTYDYGPVPMHPPPPPRSDYNEVYESDESDKGMAFSDKSVRMGFIRKVYSILLVQLLVSIAIVCWFVLHKPTKLFVRRNPGIFYAAWAVTLVLMIAIACVRDIRRKFPTNFILLSLFTLAEGYLLGAISARYNIYEVLLAMGIVAVVSLAITVFAFQTKYDFTMMGGCLFVAVIVLFCFGLLTIFFYSKILMLVYSCVGALLFAFFLVYDTQIMLGGGKAYAISPEEYVFAALNLYIDIVTMFIYILSIIGLARSD